MPKPLRKQSNAPRFTFKNHLSQFTYLEKYITDSSLKMSKCRMLVCLPSTLCALCIETKRNFVNQTKVNITL